MSEYNPLSRTTYERYQQERAMRASIEKELIEALTAKVPVQAESLDKLESVMDIEQVRAGTLTREKLGSVFSKTFEANYSPEEAEKVRADLRTFLKRYPHFTEIIEDATGAPCDGNVHEKLHHFTISELEKKLSQLVGQSVFRTEEEPKEYLFAIPKLLALLYPQYDKYLALEELTLERRTTEELRARVASQLEILKETLALSDIEAKNPIVNIDRFNMYMQEYCRKATTNQAVIATMIRLTEDLKKKIEDKIPLQRKDCLPVIRILFLHYGFGGDMRNETQEFVALAAHLRPPLEEYQRRTLREVGA